MKKSELPVAIIGAGIGGLAAAVALRAQGVAVHVYEQARQFARIGAGIQMSPNAMRVLDGFGLRPQLEEIAFSPRSSLNRAHDTGAVTNEFPLAEAVLERYGMPFLAMHRGDLHAALAARVPQEHMSLGKKLVHLDQETARPCCGSRMAARPARPPSSAPTACIPWCASCCWARSSPASPAASPTGRRFREPAGLARHRPVAHEMVGAGPPHRHLLRHPAPG